MPTRPHQILELLRAKQGDFQRFDAATLEGLKAYRQSLADFGALAEGQPGAIVESLAAAPHGIIASQLQWSNREDSLDWVRQHLQGVATFAVDGSQIYPSKDISIPVALVQVGWFENRHEPGGNYEKDVRLDLLTPEDLRDLRGGLADRKVNVRRFQMEVQRLTEYVEEHRGDRRCLVFLDGSLVANFAQDFDPETQRQYTGALVNLLQASAHHQVPVVAYVDTSYARDLTELLRGCFNLPELPTLRDAALINGRMQWGDRSVLLRCQGEFLRNHYGNQADQIGFCYLKANDGPPARLEIPLWIHEAGRLSEVLDWIRGEIIIGSGYPYAIETADQVAVLQADDRQLFYRILQDWAEDSQLNLRLSRKMVSKARRRF
ncbi:MAG: DNA double-strand break repair nuclease NurA [Prochlorothrix sp.]